jgi:acyl-CoA synthetase (AMP-forming)/AMP-acid ligase II
MNVAWLLAHSARREPHAAAWKFGSRSATYGELAGKVRRLAVGLRAQGLKPGDRVVLCLPNRPELVETLLATLWAGMVAVPVNWHLHPEEVRYIIGQCGARAVVVSDATGPVIGALPADAARPMIVHADSGDGIHLESLALSAAAETGGPAEVASSQPAWLFYTSGTTGRPKGAALSHRSLLAMTLNYYADVDPIAPGSVLAHAAPLTHGSGLYLIPAIGRAAANVISDAATFDAAGFLALLGRERATHIAFLAPTMLRRLIDTPGSPAPTSAPCAASSSEAPPCTRRTCSEPRPASDRSSPRSTARARPR